MFCDIWQAKIPKSEDRYPELVVSLSKKADSTCETIEMRACVKEEKKVPLDYWTFVHGNPGGREKNIRPLFPFEVLPFFKLSLVEGNWIVVDKCISADIW